MSTRIHFQTKQRVMMEQTKKKIEKVCFCSKQHHVVNVKKCCSFKLLKKKLVAE